MHRYQSAEPETVHFSHPRIPRFHRDARETVLSNQAREDKLYYFNDCVRRRNSNFKASSGNTRGGILVNAGTVSIFPVYENSGQVYRPPYLRPYVVLGLLSNSTSIPKEEIVYIQSPTRLFEELRQAASKLRPWPIRILSLKTESGFGVYECTELGIHRRVQVDQSTQNILSEMFRTYKTRRRDIYSIWLSFVHKELNQMDANPRSGKYSLHLILCWSARKLVIWGSIPILLSLVIGFWYMFKSHPGGDPVAIVQTAWGISSYIVTAGALAIAVVAAATQLGNN